MMKVFLLSLFIVGAFCRPHESPEEIQKEIDDFKGQLQVKYEETKNSGRQGFQQFLNFLQEQKGQIDQHYEQYKTQQAHADEIRHKVQDLAKYLRELKEKAVDDAVGWTQESADAANALWEQIKDYERIPEERVVRTRRSPNEDSAGHLGQAWDHAKDAVKSAGSDRGGEEAGAAIDHAKESFKSQASQNKGHAEDSEHNSRRRRSPNDDSKGHLSQAWEKTKEAVSASDGDHAAEEGGAAFDHAKESFKSQVSENKGHQEDSEHHRRRRNDDSKGHLEQAWDHAKEAAASHDGDRAAEETGAAFDHAKESIKSHVSEEKGRKEDSEGHFLRHD